MRKKLPRGTLAGLWSDPGNWRGLGIYHCGADPRIIVPKKMSNLGWTMNFAHYSGWLFVIGMVVSLAVPVAVLKSFNNSVVLAVFVAAWVAAVILTCRLMSSASRYEEE